MSYRRRGSRASVTRIRSLFFESLECAAYDKKNVARVNRVAFSFAAALKFECRLQLRLEIVHAANRDFRFFHQLE